MDLQLQLEMPLEALVLRHPAAAAGSLWACLAVLAAAIGLWRIRSAAVASGPEDLPGVHPDQSHQSRRPSSPQPQPEAREASRKEARTPSHVAAPDEGTCVGSPQKGTLFEARGCYELEDEGDDRGMGATFGEDCDQEEERQEQRKAWAGGVAVGVGVGVGVVYGGRGSCWDERWRRDLGWYLHQDMAALNGRVVRLWEDKKGLAASRLMRRRWLLGQEVEW